MRRCAVPAASPSQQARPGALPRLSNGPVRPGELLPSPAFPCRFSRSANDRCFFAPEFLIKELFPLFTFRDLFEIIVDRKCSLLLLAQRNVHIFSDEKFFLKNS
jgi:hypothetical protein